MSGALQEGLRRLRSERITRWAVAKPWQTNAALIFLGFLMLALARQLISEDDHYTIGTSGVSGWSVVVYVVACFLILTQKINRWTFPIILTFAIACRLVTLFPDPFLSSDVYRYAWDGVVQHAHISPYRYVPGDKALTFLRAPNQDLFDNMNRRDYAHTIYPPVAQMLFYVITYINPSVTFMKMAMILFEGVTMWGLLQLLAAFGVRREQTLLYAWCPLVIWEIGGSGHLDSAAMAFIALALLARYRRQPVATGIFLGIAIMIKLYPLVLLPALFRRGEYKMPAIIAGIIAFGYACYASVGMQVFGFLGGYVKEEGMETGTRYFLLDQVQHLPGLHNLSTTFFLVFAALVFGGLTLWCWQTCCRSEWNSTSAGSLQAGSGALQAGSGALQAGGRAPLATRLFGLPPRADFLLPAFALAFAMMLLFSPHYPWYIAWLIPFLTLMPNLPVFTYVCALFYLCTTDLAVGYGPKQFQLNQRLYGVVLLAVVLAAILRRWPLHRYIFQRVTPAPLLLTPEACAAPLAAVPASIHAGGELRMDVDPAIRRGR
jgi:alpha-1,6-mannosyltransferase